MLARVEREAILQNENCQIKVRTVEHEAKGLKEEVSYYLLLLKKTHKIIEINQMSFYLNSRLSNVRVF